TGKIRIHPWSLRPYPRRQNSGVMREPRESEVAFRETSAHGKGHPSWSLRREEAMKAAVYSRFSTDRQNESSIADQVRVCAEYAAGQGWQVVEQFEDQGISGAALGNRPGVLRLQDAAFARRVDAVLVTDFSRLSRSQGDLSK